MNARARARGELWGEYSSRDLYIDDDLENGIAVYLGVVLLISIGVLFDSDYMVWNMDRQLFQYRNLNSLES